jgi:hypothetical protein
MEQNRSLSPDWDRQCHRLSVPEFTRALQAGHCGIGPVTVFDTADFRTHTGGQVHSSLRVR